MKMRKFKRKPELIYFIYTRPKLLLIPMVEWSLYAKIEEESVNGVLTISLDDLFKERTHTKKDRFVLISKLIKRKLISKIKISKNIYQFNMVNATNREHDTLAISCDRNNPKKLLSKPWRIEKKIRECYENI